MPQGCQPQQVTPQWRTAPRMGNNGEDRSFSPPLPLHCSACSFGPMKLAFCFSYLQPISCHFCIPELGLLAEKHTGHWPLHRATCMVLQTECLCLPEFMVEF